MEHACIVRTMLKWAACSFCAPGNVSSATFHAASMTGRLVLRSTTCPEQGIEVQGTGAVLKDFVGPEPALPAICREKNGNSNR